MLERVLGMEDVRMDNAHVTAFILGNSAKTKVFQIHAYIHVHMCISVISKNF